MGFVSDPRAASPAPTLEGMPSTRASITLALKKRGEARADELAATLGITASAVRQHLGGMVASGLVGFREQKGSPGRPKHVYHLTPAAEALFPKTYTELTNELLAYVESQDPDMLDRAFEQRRRRRVERARARLGRFGFDRRVKELARILDEDGYLAEFERSGNGRYRITEHNCAILGVAERYRQACTTEISFIREVLPEAVVERVDHMMAGAHVCRYEITRRPDAETP